MKSSEELKQERELRNAIDFAFEQGEKKGREEVLKEWREEGRREGKQEAKITIAKELLQIGLSLEQIAEITGLSIEQIQQLNNSYRRD